MERLLDRLERRLGRHALHNFTLLLVSAQLAALVLSLARPAFANALLLDPEAVRQGQVWRLVTYLFLPPSFNPIWAIFALYWLYAMGTALESQWGAFRYQLFWLSGALLTTVGAFVFGVPADNSYLLMSLFLAFATLWPDYELVVFFVLPVKVKWLALLDAAFLIRAIMLAPGWASLLPLLAIGNYLLFFAGALRDLARGKARSVARSSERARFSSPPSGVPPVRRCAICGVTSADDPDMDFRVCTCAKHEGPTELCITHARDH